jgi:hypothetical protein
MAAGLPLEAGLPLPLTGVAKGGKLRVRIEVELPFFCVVLARAAFVRLPGPVRAGFADLPFGGGGFDPTLVDLPTPVIFNQN